MEIFQAERLGESGNRECVLLESPLLLENLQYINFVLSIIACSKFMCNIARGILKS